MLQLQLYFSWVSVLTIATVEPGVSVLENWAHNEWIFRYGVETNLWWAKPTVLWNVRVLIARRNPWGVHLLKALTWYPMLLR